MITLETTISRNNTHVVATKIDEEVVILNSHNGNYYGLDEVGARIWGNYGKTVCNLQNPQHTP